MSRNGSIFSGVLTRRLAVGAVVFVAGFCAATPAYASTIFELSPFAGTGSTGTPTAGPATSTDLDTPYGVAVDASGDVYIADYGNLEVEKVTPSGSLSIIAGTGSYGTPTPGPATSSDVGVPEAVAVDASGDVYIADSANDYVYKVTPAGQLSIFAGDGSSSGTPTAGLATATTIGQPFGVAVDGEGNVYISDGSNARVYKVTPAGQLSFVAGDGTDGAPTPGPATSSDLSGPKGLALDAAGDLYIANYGDGLITKVTPSGTLSIVAGNGTNGNPTPGPATSSQLNDPWGLALDAAGDLYIADDGGDIDEVTPSGTLSVIAGDDTYGPPTYGVPATGSDLEGSKGIASTLSGRLYVDDSYNNTIELLTPPLPGATVLPTISGTAEVGDTLTASTGTWTNSPVIYTYQWQECDSSGANCTVITGATASTYAVTSSDAGHTIRVVVAAQNGDGSASIPSLQTAVVPTPAASTSPTTGTTSTPSDASIPAPEVAAGINLSPAGSVTLPLTCSAGDGCQATVTFAIARSAITSGASGTATIARVTGAVVAAGATSDLDVKLSEAVLRGLQASGARRVQVTVTVTNSDGTTSPQQLWLNLPAGLDVCPAPTGRITGTTLGPIKLGQTKEAFEGRYPRHKRQRFGFSWFCFSSGAGFRVEYPTVTVLTSGKYDSLRGRVVVAMTANRHYSIDGIHPGMKLTAVSSRVHVGQGMQGGKNRWYVISGKAANAVLKVRNGVIEGIGIAVKQLTNTQAEQRVLFDQAALNANR